MKITAFDAAYPMNIATGGTWMASASGSNSGASGGDILGSPGDLSVVGLRSIVSIASNAGDSAVGTILTTIQTSPWVVTFAAASNSGASAGSNSTRVSETSIAGVAATFSPSDHQHDGIGTVTASSSNTMQRGTLHLRPGANVSFSLTDADSDGEFDTLTVNGAAGGAGGSALTIEEVDGSPSVAATKLVLPNGTLGVVGTVATYTPAAGGGGAPTTAKYVTTASDGTLSAEVVRPQLGNFFAETPPASANATYDDEFDDGTGMSGAGNGLDARWNWRNQGTATATFGTQGYLSLNAPASAGNFRIIEIAALADGTYEALISLEGAQALGAGKGEHAGIVTIDATNGDFYLFGFIKDNATVYFGLQKWTNVTTWAANTALRTLGTNVIPPPLYVRYVKAGTVSTWYASLDGIAWTRVYTEATDGVVPTRIGLAVNESTNTGATKLLVDYFRKTA